MVSGSELRSTEFWYLLVGVCHRRAEAEGVAEQEQVPQGEAEGGV